MHYLEEEHIFAFLEEILLLLVVAKVLGALCQRRGIPALAGEIMAGVILGKTVLGRVAPAFFETLFPQDVAQMTMIETVSWFGVLFLLLSTGFEVNISTVWRQGKAALYVGIIGVVIPFVIGCAAFAFVPEEFIGPAATRLTFTLFMAAAASITAISIVARITHDLDILKSDVGLISLSACAVNDLFGWLIFTVVLALVGGSDISPDALFRVFFEIILFATVCLTVGSKIVGNLTRWLKSMDLPQPATTLTLVACLGMLCGAVTHWIGIHAVLGFFLAGIMAGNTTEISERNREAISQTIHAVFVPVFFASIGLKIDFLAESNLVLVIFFSVVAIGGKFVGAWAGARMADLSKPDSLSMGILFTPGGAMEIIVGMLAMELALISESVFVAIVVAALLSSVLVGPLMAWSIRHRRGLDIVSCLGRGSVLELEASTREEAIAALCNRAVRDGDLDYAVVYSAVSERESIMGTGLERGVAVPHARLSGLDDPMIVFGRSRVGIDWDAPDGMPARLVFMVLTPQQENGTQVQILAAIASAMLADPVREALLQADDLESVERILRDSLAGTATAA